MKNNMLEYSKLILEKVSFDKKLFEKELLKCIDDLIWQEARELKKWCKKNFSTEYHNLVDRCYRRYSRKLHYYRSSGINLV